MKFVILTCTKDTASMLPPAVSRQLLEASLDYVNQLKKAGKILETYELAGSSRTISIGEFDSAEELSGAVAALPFSVYLSIEAYPLADFNEYMKASIESIKKAEKLSLDSEVY